MTADPATSLQPPASCEIFRIRRPGNLRWELRNFQGVRRFMAGDFWTVLHTAHVHGFEPVVVEDGGVLYRVSITEIDRPGAARPRPAKSSAGPPIVHPKPARPRGARARPRGSTVAAARARS